MDTSSVKLLLKEKLKFGLKIFFKCLFTLLLVIGSFLVSMAGVYFLDELFDLSYYIYDFMIWFLGLFISSLSISLLWKLGGSKKSACLRSLITAVVYSIILTLLDRFGFYLDDIEVLIILSVVVSILFPLIWCRGSMYRIIVNMGKCFVIFASIILGVLLNNWVKYDFFDSLGVDSSYISLYFATFFITFIVPILVIPQLFISGKKKRLSCLGVTLVLSFVCVSPTLYHLNEAKLLNESSIIIPNIKTEEYLPFVEDTKIVKLDKEASLSFRDLRHEELPIVDGAAAFFPVYSAYVNAVYPDTVELYEGFIPANRIGQYPFVYSNTVLGYEELAEKKTDIFFGVYPSEGQIEYAKDNGTEFEFTQIGTEAFVFFVHKDNPVDDVTVEELKDIYSGKTRNWISLGGKLKGIKAYQRNEGSGSQSMLERFMGDTPIMKPPTHLVQGFMSGIIEEVSEYQNRNSAIGFSFRYYVDGIIGNPDIKVLKVNGVAPTDENIKNGTYPIVTPIYAVTWAGNEKPTVKPFLNWVLSEEGQEILEKSGYVGLAELPKEAHPEPVDKDKAFSDISRNEGGYFERALHVDEP